MRPSPRPKAGKGGSGQGSGLTSTRASFPIPIFAMSAGLTYLFRKACTSYSTYPFIHSSSNIC